MLLNGQTLQVIDENGKDVIDDSFFLIINAAAEGVEFKLPASPSGQPWCVVLDTEDVDNPFTKAKADDKVIIGGRSLKLLSDRSLS